MTADRPGRLALAIAMVSGTFLLGACGSSPAETPAAGTGSTPIAVLASTNVWGDVAAEVGGSRVTVSSLMNDPSADPHSYQASVQNQLAVSKAALIIENGGGYDDFVDTMVKAAKSGAPVVTAVKLLPAAAAGGEVNEHVWYDLPTVKAVANAIKDKLTAIDPAGAADYGQNVKAFTDKVTGLEKKEAAIKTRSAGTAVAITEPVPVYALEASGLVNKTPAEFSKAIESETDVPAAVLAQTLKLFTDKQVKALVYNAQTTGPQTEKVEQAAKNAGIAVVPVTETLPQGKGYLTWMGGQLDALAAAVA